MFHWEQVAQRTWALMRGNGALEFALVVYESPAIIHEIAARGPESAQVEYRVSGALFDPVQFFPTLQSAQAAAEVAVSLVGELVG